MKKQRPRFLFFVAPLFLVIAITRAGVGKAVWLAPRPVIPEKIIATAYRLVSLLDSSRSGTLSRSDLDSEELSLVELIERYGRNFPAPSFKIQFGEKGAYFIPGLERMVRIGIHEPRNTLRRVFRKGSLGLAHCYGEGLIEVSDADYPLYAEMFVRIAVDDDLNRAMPWRTRWALLKSSFQGSGLLNFRRNRRDNINRHYSLEDWFSREEDANEFYRTWLETPGFDYLFYSSGLWTPDTRTLAEAQRNKLEHYAQRLGLQEAGPDQVLVDLGAGWGGAIFYYAEHYPIQTVGVTLSVAQYERIQAEIRRRGLEGRVRVELKDMFDLEGQYDFILSIGALEHIRDTNGLYRLIARSLKPAGKALIHSMFYDGKNRYRDPFFQTYIFPGGAIPLWQKNLRLFRRQFHSVDPDTLPAGSYPETLARWYENFVTHQGRILTLLHEKTRFSDEEAVFYLRVFKHYLTLARAVNCYFQVSNVLVQSPRHPSAQMPEHTVSLRRAA